MPTVTIDDFTVASPLVAITSGNGSYTVSGNSKINLWSNSGRLGSRATLTQTGISTANTIGGRRFITLSDSLTNAGAVPCSFQVTGNRLVYARNPWSLLHLAYFFWATPSEIASSHRTITSVSITFATVPYAVRVQVGGMLPGDTPDIPMDAASCAASFPAWNLATSASGDEEVSAAGVYSWTAPSSFFHNKLQIQLFRETANPATSGSTGTFEISSITITTP